MGSGCTRQSRVHSNGESQQASKVTSTQTIPPLLSCQQLKQLLQTSPNSIAILETDFGKQNERDFHAGHIPTARFFDQLECTTPTDYIPRGLPDVKSFEDYLTRLGVSNVHHIVLYDRSPAGFFASSRAWCVLKAYGVDKLSILNGGFHGWVKANNDIEKSENTEKIKQTKRFTVKLNNKRVRTFEQMMENLSSKTSDAKRVQIVDARPPNMFYGTDAGHMPHALHLPYASVLDQTNQCLKPHDELKEIFNKAGVNLSKPAIYTCQTGTTASTLAFVSHLLGQKEQSVYIGAFIEWQQRAPANMIIKGDAKSNAS